MTPERAAKFRRVASRRQPNLTVILENVHDPHNIGAVLRTCDSVGIKEIFVLYSEPQLNREHLELGKQSSSGARRWVDVHFYTNTKACFDHVKKNYQHIFSTHLSENAVSVYELDLCASVALLFGNERDGLSEEALGFSDGNFLIPQIGMVESLNISVACAVTLYEAFRQRKNEGYYKDNLLMKEQEIEQLFQHYARIHDTKDKRANVKRLNK